VFALYRRIRDLKDIEHAHGDVVLDVRQGARHPEEADLALVSQGDELGHRVVLLESALRRADVELDRVDVVGPHAPHALFDAGPDVLAGEGVLAESLRSPVRADRTTALTGQNELVATTRDVRSDQLF
jgi:hypothetical protein